MNKEHSHLQEQVDEAVGNKKIKSLSFYMGAWGATIPMLFFVVWAITISLLNISSEPALIMGALIGLALGMFFSKSKWSDYAQGIFDGMAQPVGIVAIVAWFWAGMFAQILKTGGLVEGLVWIGSVTGLTGAMFVGLTFVLASVFSSAVGTGYGTVVAFSTLMYPAGVIMGADPVVLFAAILSGAAFGDNYAPVSDTTIVSAVTQDADIPGVVRSRFKYAIIAAVPALILFLIFGGGGQDIGLSQAEANQIMAQSASPDGLILLIPFILVIYLALRGKHLITTLTWGILSAIVLMVLVGLADLRDFIYFEEGQIKGPLVDGFMGYMNMAILILLIMAASHLMALGGTMNSLKQVFFRWIKGVVRRAELTIWSIVSVLNVFITINTAAEIAAAPFVKEIGKQYDIHPYRRANMLDAISSALGYIFPWSAALLLGWSTIGQLQETSYSWLPVVMPTEAFPYVFHGWFLVLVMLIAALTGWGLRFTGKNGEEIKPEEKKIENNDK
ncbi:Na+/H+ antiporter NhaC family protein [Microaerobacter geothermalis]|uniref:Na+/H+ antiporter NhaC family protein n=1 Tax=Microaerobacter geothermalis TaxID=674972 RepID=UPI001F1B4DA3|nr:Na+/H+ antiporter NhaC family protein [Microaerobacter geothermalis]MCF6093742.1 Na+/H+ antiporter NhaC family protein [Microaerobacter geothermalis]